MEPRIGPSRFLNPKIAANLPSQKAIDCAMAGNCRRLVVLWIVINAVLAAFSEEATSVRLQMTDQVLPFHDVAIENPSLETM